MKAKKTKPLEKLLQDKKQPDTFQKQVTSVKLEDTGSSELNLGSMSPTDEQLEKINTFARSPQTAESVVVLPTLACNDMIDRDVEKFSTGSIKELVTMQPPYSPIGKSFLVGHDHTSLPIGRIFDAEAEKIGDVNFLKLYSYIPNIDANKSYIENVDAGVYWAVSVGLTMGAATCNVGGKEHEWSWNPWFCSQGHEKGMYYDPNSEEKDDWGYPVPVEDTSKGVLCYRELSDPKDFYELSQVYLGAQYHAELTAKKPFQGIRKSALFSPNIPIIGLSAKEAKELPVPQNNILKEVNDHFDVDYLDNGDATWKDNNGLYWQYSATDQKVKCLGKEYVVAEPVAPEVTTGTLNAEKVTISTLDAKVKDKFMNEEELTAAKEAGVAEELIEEAKKADKPALFLFRKAHEIQAELDTVKEELNKIKPKVEAADRYVKELKADAIAWYVKNNQVGQEKGVDVSLFQKILDACGDNIELIKELKQQQEEMAKAKFPATTRRSTAQEDPHKKEEIKTINPEREDKIRKLHG